MTSEQCEPFGLAGFILAGAVFFTEGPRDGEVMMVIGVVGTVCC